MKQFDRFEDHVNYVEQWLSGEDDRRPVDLLQARKYVITPAAELSDSRLRKALADLLETLASIKVYLDNTDHLSDRALYEKVVTEVLPMSMSIGGDDWDLYDFAHGQDDESVEVYLAYYADEDDREMWGMDRPLPARRSKPYDRDRRLPRPDDWEEVS